jgi:hypothetical protein
VVDGLRVVRSGLAPTERVIIEGTQMAMPGAKVQVRRGQIVAPENAEPPAGATGTLPASGATVAD